MTISENTKTSLKIAGTIVLIGFAVFGVICLIWLCIFPPVATAITTTGIENHFYSGHHSEYLYSIVNVDGEKLRIPNNDEFYDAMGLFFWTESATHPDGDLVATFPGGSWVVEIYSDEKVVAYTEGAIPGYKSWICYDMPKGCVEKLRVFLEENAITEAQWNDLIETLPEDQRP